MAKKKGSVISRAMLDDILRLLNSESDRGCVLVASAYIEELVREMLCRYCRANSKRNIEDNELSHAFRDFESQFYNFASSVRLARVLDIITIDLWAKEKSVCSRDW
jgi:hypothetical protein